MDCRPRVELSRLPNIECLRMFKCEFLRACTADQNKKSEYDWWGWVCLSMKLVQY